MSIRVPRGSELPDHAFGWGQLVYATSGVGRVTAQSAHWVLPAGRALWVPSGVRHVLHAVTALDLRTLYFPKRRPPLRVSTPTILHIEPLLRELILRAVDVALQLSERTRRLRSVLYDELSTARSEELQLPMPIDDRARDFASLVLSQHDFTQPLAELISQVGASRRTLERRFVEETGISLGVWFRQARLQYSLLLLGQGVSVAEVSDACGYSTPSAFIAAFRAEMNGTPGTYFSR